MNNNNNKKVKKTRANRNFVDYVIEQDRFMYYQVCKGNEYKSNKASSNRIIHNINNTIQFISLER